MSEPWQLQLYRRSLKKKATVKAMLEHLPRVRGAPLPGGRLRDRAHVSLPAPARRHLDQHRLRARPRAVRPGAGARPGAADRRPLAAVPVGGLRPGRRDQLPRAHQGRRSLLRRDGAGAQAGRRLPLHGAQGGARRAGFALKRLLGFTADQEGFGHARDGYPPARRAVADGESRVWWWREWTTIAGSSPSRWRTS